MCRHILNAQVSVRAACCLKWYDCPECHAEANDHALAKSYEMVLACKKCKKVFRKDARCGVVGGRSGRMQGRRSRRRRREKLPTWRRIFAHSTHRR